MNEMKRKYLISKVNQSEWINKNRIRGWLPNNYRKKHKKKQGKNNRWLVEQNEFNNKLIMHGGLKGRIDKLIW